MRYKRSNSNFMLSDCIAEALPEFSPLIKFTSHLSYILPVNSAGVAG